jgi:DNA-binding response OmpR family regulator
MKTVRARVNDHSADDLPKSSDAAASPLRILLVEDHEHTGKVLARLLQSVGHHVIVADSVASAINAATKNTFDLLISDLGLPDGSGHDLMRRLKAAHDLDGICLSGYGMEEDVARSLDAGFREHLTKPVNFEKLRAAVDRAAMTATRR